MRGRYEVIAYNSNDKGILDAFSEKDVAMKLAASLNVYLKKRELYTKLGKTYDTLTVYDKKENNVLWSSEE